MSFPSGMFVRPFLCTLSPFTLDAKPGGELFTIGVLIANDLFGVELCNLAIGVAESPSQISNRRSGSDHPAGKPIPRRIPLTRLQITCTNLTDHLLSVYP